MKNRIITRHLKEIVLHIKNRNYESAKRLIDEIKLLESNGEELTDNKNDSFTQKELQAMLYHTSYDRDTLIANEDLKDYELDFTLEDSDSAIVKLNKLLNNK